MTTLRKTLSFVLLLLTAYAFAGNNPDWTDYNKRQSLYPKDKYLTGFASTGIPNKDVAGETLKRLENDARNELVQSIQSSIKVKSSTSTQSTNTNNSTFGFSQKFNDFTEVSAETKVVGLKIETYYDKKEKTGYALAYILISDLVNYYKNQVDTKMDEAKALIDDGKNDLLTGKPQMAFPKFEKAINIYPTTASAKNTLLALGKNQLVTMYDNDITEAKNEIGELVNQAIESTTGGITVKAIQSSIEIDLQSSNSIDVIVSQNSSNAPVANFPVSIFYPEQKQVTSQAFTDAQGKAHLILSKLTLDSKTFTLKAMPDVQKLFNSDTSTYIYKSYIDNNSAIPSANVTTHVKKFSVYIESLEKSVNQPLPTAIISPKIKAELSSLGGSVIEDKDIADIIVSIDANTTLVSQTEYVSVVMAEAHVTIISNKTKAQLMGKNFNGFRGFGKTSDLATSKAYNELCKNVINDIKGNLVK
jgi:hypothetical protein